MSTSNVKNDSKLNEKSDVKKKQNNSQMPKNSISSKAFRKEEINKIESILEYTQINSVDNFKLLLQTSPEERKSKIINTLKLDAKAQQCKQIIHGLMMCLHVYMDAQGNLRPKKKKITDVAADFVQSLNSRLCNHYKKDTLQNLFTITEKIFGEELLKKIFTEKEIPPLGENLIKYTKCLSFSIIRHAANTKDPHQALEIGYQNGFEERKSLEYTLPMFKSDVKHLEKKAKISSIIVNQQASKVEKVEKNVTLNKRNSKLITNHCDELSIDHDKFVYYLLKSYKEDRKLQKNMGLKP